MGESKTMKRIRVLHSELNGELGGIESFLYNVYRFIDKEKVEFDFLTISDANYIEKLYDDISESGADVAVPAFCISFENGDCAVDSRVKEVTTYSKKEALEVFLFNGYLTPCVASKMWKKSLWQKIRCPEGKLFEDQYTTYAIVFVLVCAVKVFCSLFGGSDISKLLDLPTFYFMFAVIILECKENRLKGNFYKHLRSTSETMYFIHMYFVAFCALVLYKDDYNNFKSYLICAGGALAVSEIYSWMKNISNRSTTVSRLKHD